MDCFHCGCKTFAVGTRQVCSSCGYIQDTGSREAEEELDNGK
jgi:ribosomal protein L37E